MKFSLILLCFLLHYGNGNENAKRLYDDLLTNYNRLKRPVENTTKTLTVKLRLRLAQIVDLIEKEQVMISSIWLKHEWEDYKLRWVPEDYDNTTVLYVPSDMVWTPDLVLYNSVDETKIKLESSTKATLNFNGKIEWEAPALVKTICPIKVQWFPFDVQSCVYKFGSWTYPVNLLDLAHMDEAEFVPEVNPQTGDILRISTVKRGIDLKDYYPSVEWEILEVPARRYVSMYPNREIPGTKYKGFADITYTVVLRRMPLFYMVNVVLPCVALLFLTILDFYLPSECGEKVALGISILVCLTVFFLLLTETFPPNSDNMPLLAQYLIFTFIMVTMAVVMTIFVLNLFFRSPSTHRMPKWVKKVFLKTLPKYLFMRPPIVGENEDSFRRMSSKSRFGTLTSSSQRSGQQTVQQQQRPASPNDSAAASQMIQSWHSSFKKRPTNFLALPGGSEATSVKQRMERIVNSPQALRAFENVCYIAEVLKQKDKDDKIDEDWKFVAMVVDRLFLFIFTVVSFFGTAVILLQVPALYDYRKEIKPVEDS